MALNAWGYEIASLPPLLTVADFEDLTGHTLSATTKQMEATLNGASQVVRDYCGWHVAPSVQCSWRGDADGRFVHLPVMFVSDVASVSVDGRALSANEYQWKQDGLIRLARPVDDWGRRVEVTFTAGVPATALAAVVAQVATNYLVAPAGVSSETAGGVSISYNSTGYGMTGGIRLHSTDKATLAQYRIPR